MNGIPILICCLLATWRCCDAQRYIQPEQVHLSIGASTDTMVVTWVTFTSTGSSSSTVQYSAAGKSESEFNLTATGSEDAFVDGGQMGRTLYMHRVALKGLQPTTLYNYRVGAPGYGWSSPMQFRSLSTNPADLLPLKLLVYGDMGNYNSRCIAQLQTEVARTTQPYHAVLHLGDFAYNMDSNNAYYGDEFMRQIEPIASRLPYMTIPGNHEASYNFSNYRHRFTMPQGGGGDGQGQFYSFNLGPVHVIGFSSEFYYYYGWYGFQQIVNQYEWLKRDLAEANKPENRKRQPWIIAMGHRPMYCSNSDDPPHCPNVYNTIRVGFPPPKSASASVSASASINHGKHSAQTGDDLSKYEYGLEKLFYEQGVDMVLGAHEHSYERMLPTYNRSVCQSNTFADPYQNPKGPLHYVIGSAGNQEGEDPFIKMPYPYSAFQSSDYGYTRMTVFNATHLQMEQVSQDKGFKVIDKTMHVQEKHDKDQFNCKANKEDLLITDMIMKKFGKSRMAARPKK